MIFKNYNEFKSYFRKMFKKYHPDNKLTGDTQQFIKYKELYDKVQKKNTKHISIEEAYNGSIIEYDNIKIQLPKYFYNRKIKLSEESYIDLIITPQKDEKISYDKNGNLLITKIIHFNLFHIIFGMNYNIHYLGKEIRLKVKPYEIFKLLPYIKLKNMGYPLKKNTNKRSFLSLQFKFDVIKFDYVENNLLKKMRERYEPKQ